MYSHKMSLFYGDTVYLHTPGLSTVAIRDWIKYSLTAVLLFVLQAAAMGGHQGRLLQICYFGPLLLPRKVGARTFRRRLFARVVRTRSVPRVRTASQPGKEVPLLQDAQ